MNKKQIIYVKASDFYDGSGLNFDKYPYSTGQKYIIKESGLVYEDIGGHRISPSKLRYTEIGESETFNKTIEQ